MGIEAASFIVVAGVLGATLAVIKILRAPIAGALRHVG
jgi:UPF0716 family protein affecting phage T7 exclusion